MIKNINKTCEGNKLKVEVECIVREFVSHPIKVLTTEDLLDILNKENIYNISKTLKEPSHRVGNSNVKKFKNIGIWLFEVENETKEEKVEKPKRKPTTRKRKPTTKKPSIRNRMSKLANPPKKD